MTQRGSGPLQNLKQISEKREERRRQLTSKLQEKQALKSQATEGTDYVFHSLLSKTPKLFEILGPDTFTPDSDPNFKFKIIIRKRPLLQKEIQTGELDIVSNSEDKIRIHECKHKVDGITKFIVNSDFEADRVFGHLSNTEDIYIQQFQAPIFNLLEQSMNASSKEDNILTIFAFGQTSSGKTHTMQGVAKMAAKQIFRTNDRSEIKVSSFEIYGGKPYDLLNGRQKVSMMEDASQRIQIQNLTEHSVNTAEELTSTLEQCWKMRITQQTLANDTSSRSHAVYQIQVKQQSLVKLLLVDLAGSEWDTQLYEKQRRIEAAEINKSLLAIKECIRALDNKGARYVPFRGSKMTLMLKDSFTHDNAKVIMIVCVAPSISSTDHTLVTLRYATSFRENSKQLAGLHAVKNFKVPQDDFEIHKRNENQRPVDMPSLYRNSSQKYIKYASGKKLSINEVSTSVEYHTQRPSQDARLYDDKKILIKAKKFVQVSKGDHTSLSVIVDGVQSQNQLPPITHVIQERPIIKNARPSAYQFNNLPPLNCQTSQANPLSSDYNLTRYQSSNQKEKFSQASLSDLIQPTKSIGQGLVSTVPKTLKPMSKKQINFASNTEIQSENYSQDEDRFSVDDNEAEIPSNLEQKKPKTICSKNLQLRQQLLRAHVQTLKLSAKLLEREGALLKDDGERDQDDTLDVEAYVMELDDIVAQKLQLYLTLQMELKKTKNI